MASLIENLIAPGPSASPAGAAGGGAPAAPAPFTKEAAVARRFGLGALALAFGGFLVWAALAPLDEGVPSVGTVAIDTKRKPVQHLTGGIVREVLVREGEQVREGQRLVRLDEAATRGNYEAIRQRYFGLRAMQARLVAEQAGADALSFHADLAAESNDPLIREHMRSQDQLFHSRRAALRAELQALEEGMAGQGAVIESARGQIASRRGQLDLLQEELGQTRELVKEGYAPRNRQLELERMAAEVRASLADLQGTVLRAQRSISELRQRQVQRRQEYRKEVDSMLADVAREVDADGRKFHALRDDLERMEIRSPATGQVVGLAVQTAGAVISPGQKLMDIVPGSEGLLVESRVPPHLIDRVHAGLPVDVRFAAFAHSPQLVVDGELVSIAGDLLADPNTNVHYYLARVAVTPAGLRQLGQRVLQPGMPVEVVLKTGERSLLTYLLHPLTKRLAGAMKEE